MVQNCHVILFSVSNVQCFNVFATFSLSIVDFQHDRFSNRDFCNFLCGSCGKREEKGSVKHGFLKSYPGLRFPLFHALPYH